MHQQSGSRLFKIPPELRGVIYGFVFAKNKPDRKAVVPLLGLDSETLNLDVLLTCKAIYTEAVQTFLEERENYWAKTTFTIVDFTTCDLKNLIEPPMTTKIKHVRKIEFLFHAHAHGSASPLKATVAYDHGKWGLDIHEEVSSEQDALDYLLRQLRGPSYRADSIRAMVSPILADCEDDFRNDEEIVRKGKTLETIVGVVQGIHRSALRSLDARNRAGSWA